MPIVPVAATGTGATQSGLPLSELQQGVYDRIGVPTTDPKFPAAKITRFVNSALRQIATKRNWPWLQVETSLAVVAGTAAYPTPADWTGTAALTLLRTDSTVVLLEGKPRDSLDKDYDLFATGEPECYAVYAENVAVRPVPDKGYSLTHRYTRAELTLVAAGDRPYLPAAYCDSLCDLATFLALGSSKEDNRAAAAHGRYTEWLADMGDNDRRLKRPARITVRAGH